MSNQNDNVTHPSDFAEIRCDIISIKLDFN